MNNTYTTATITHIENETPRVKNFVLDTTIEAKPGQYIMLWIPRLNEKPFGVVSPDPLTLSIANVGPFTAAVHNLRRGDTLSFRGPYGSTYKLKGKKFLLVAGGYGVVPLYFLALSMTQQQQESTTVIIGARTQEDLPFVRKFQNLGCTVEVSTDDGSQGHKGFSTQIAAPYIEKKKVDAVYTCGPLVMMKKIAQMSEEHRIYCQVSAETYFKCGGMGLCGECSIHGKLACVDGPVFEGKILLEEK